MHLQYQRKYNIDPALARYNVLSKFNASVEVLQFVLLAGADEVLHYILDLEIRDVILDTIYIELQPIHSFCLDNFCDNALVVNEQERIASVQEVEKLLLKS